jgi:hypothetical protein
MMHRLKTWARAHLRSWLGLMDVDRQMMALIRTNNDLQQAIARMTTGFVDVHQKEPTVVLLASRAGNGGHGMVRMYTVNTADERKLRDLMRDLEHLCGQVYADYPPNFYRWAPTLDPRARHPGEPR